MFHIVCPKAVRQPLCLAVALACASLAQAETELRDVVVSATLSEHDTRTAPASVTVVTRQEIEVRNAQDLLDAVRGAPGITLSPRQVGGRKTLALRGLEGKHTLTLIDGRRITPTDDVVGHSDYQYGWLPMAAVERIEIIRGPMSTLYGSEALGGVVNIITRQPQDRWIGSVAVGGSDLLGGDGGGGSRASLFAAGPVGESLSLRLVGAREKTSPIPVKEDPRYSEIEGRDERSFGLAATLRLSPGQSLEASWDEGRENRYYNDVSSARVRYETRYDIERSQGQLAWRGEFDGWRGQARAYGSEVDIVNTRTNGVAATRPQNLRDQVFDGFAAFRLGGHRITVGGEHRTETLKNAGLVGGKDDAAHKALFVQDEVALAAQWLLTAGVRADHHEIFGSETSPRLYLVWEASPELVVKGGYGHAFKAPTLKQISPNYVGAEGPHTFLGNADIQPEKSDSLEIGADWRRGPLALRGVLFRNEIKDLIDYTLLRVNGSRRTYLYDNVDRARIAGAELGFTWNAMPGLVWNADLTLLKTRDRTSGDELDDRPDYQLATRLDWDAGDGWSARLGLERVGPQTTGDGASKLPAYNLWNTSIAKRFGRAWTLRAGIDNLTDVRLAEKTPNFGYAERRRTLFASLRADF